jgi:hypothetical protein
MANYYGKTRTNYFSVTDEVKFREIIAACKASEDEVHSIDNEKEGDERKVGFYCDGSIQGLPYKLVDDEPVVTFDEDDAEEDLDNEISGNFFYDALQELLVDGDAIIVTEVGSEKMRYLLGCCLVITKNDMQHVDLGAKALKLARNMLGNPGFTTQNEY